jgi:flagellar hook assembly protein FlgD
LVNPAITRLNGNFPNPFNPVTNIRYSLKEAGRVKLNIYNLKGQLVKQLLDTEVSAGDHQVVWDGKDDRGNSVASGIYFYRMQAQNYQATNKMMLMK